MRTPPLRRRTALAGASLPVLQVEVAPAQIQFWADVMAQQGMLQDKPDVA